MPPAAPRVVGGFEILALLGRGGMGEVFRARQAGLDRIVALKVMAPKLTSDPVFSERFVREARAAGALRHPNVVRIYDAGVDVATRSSFMALELVEGEDLAAIVKREAPLEERRALEIALAVARGLEHAHEHGLLHRDVKPGNVLVTREGTPKLTDFGLAKHTEGEASLTSTGFIVGTPLYMSPEQANADPLDIRTDIYALGTMLYEMGTGTLPFSGSPVGILARKLNDDMPDPRDANPALSPSFSRLVAALTARDRDDRTATPSDAIRLIEDTLAGPGAPAGSAARAAARRRSSRRARPEAGPDLRRIATPPRGPGPGAVAAAVAGVAALTAVIVGVVATGQRAEEPGRTARPGPGSTAAPVSSSSDPAGRRDPDDGSERPPESDVPDWRTLPNRYPAGAAHFLETPGARLVDVLGAPGWRVGGMGVALAISSDGERVLAASLRRDIVVWERASGRELFFRRSPGEPGEELFAATLSRDGGWVYAGDGNGAVHVWSVDDHRLTARIEAHDQRVTDLGVSPNGSTLASGGGDGLIHVWDVAKPDQPRRIETLRTLESGRTTLGVALTTDARWVLAGSSVDGLALIDGQTGETLFHRAHPEAYSRPAITPDGRVAVHTSGPNPGEDALALGKEVTVWRIDDEGRLGEGDPTVLPIGPAGARAAAITSDGRRALTGSMNGVVELWDLDHPDAPVARIEAHRSWVQEVAFGPGGRWAASTGNDFTVRIHDLEGRTGPSRAPASPYLGHSEPVFRLLRDGLGRLVSVSGGFAVVWPDGEASSPPTALDLRQLVVGGGRVIPFRSAAIASDGSIVALGLRASGGVAGWRVAPGASAVRERVSLVHTAHAEERVAAPWPPGSMRPPDVVAVAVSAADGATLSSSEAGRIVHVADGRARPLPIEGAATALAFGGDGTGLALVGATLTSLDLGEPIRVRHERRLDGAIVALDTSPRGDEVGVISSEGAILVLSVEDLATRLERVSAAPAAATGAIELGDELLATASGSVIEVWDRSAEQPLVRIDISASGYQATSLLLDETRGTLHVGTDRGTILAFEIDRP